jgi:hypothetical protein
MKFRRLDPHRLGPASIGLLACFMWISAAAHGATTNLLVPAGDLWK